MTSRILWAALLLNLVVGDAIAQQRDRRIPDGQALGFTIDRFTKDGDGDLISFTFHVTQLKRGGMGPDFGIGTFPRVLAGLHLALTLDADAAFNIALPLMTILPRGGASTIMIAGSEVTGFGLGYNYGVSVLFNFNARDAFRIDITRRKYLEGDLFDGGVLTIGIGVSGVPSRHRD
jgi:hypothetical protein